MSNEQSVHDTGLSNSWANAVTVNRVKSALLARNSDPTKQEVTEHMQGNLCRCMTSLIQRAILRPAAEIRRIWQ